MAQSVPVIATRVGSIPCFLEHLTTALLVEPNDPSALASAIQLLISDFQLRRRLIKNGLQCARENTLARRASEMVSEIGRWMRERSGK
jgi:glycosyltransferase involved in cell wall biosynthesis